MPRGGDQAIPRPPGAREGPPAPWAAAPSPRRRLDLGTVRRRLGELAPPTDAPARVAGSREAAVLVPLFEEASQARVILTRRPDTMPTHRGEVAFPGGRHELGDDDLLATALRETSEEIGLDPATIDLVVRLDGLATWASRFTIAPFVGLLPERPELVPDRREVVRVFDVALEDLMRPDVYRSEVWAGRPGFDDEFVVSFFELDDETVWGATARILTDLLAHLVGVERPPVRRF